MEGRVRCGVDVSLVWSVVQGLRDLFLEQFPEARVGGMFKGGLLLAADLICLGVDVE